MNVQESPLLLQERVAQLEAQLRHTQQKLEYSQAQVRESEAHFRSVFEGMGEGLLITDLNDVISYANGRMAEMCGYNREEMLGRPAYQLFLPREQWPALGGYNERRARGHADVYEAQLLRKDGSRFWALIHANPLRNAQGKVVGTIGAQIDITTRKWAEQALRESEERFRQLIEQAVDAVMVHDERGQMLMANQRFCQNLGYTRAEALALRVPDFEMNFDAENVEKNWAQLQDGASMSVNGLHRRKDGTSFPVEVHVGAVQFDGKRVMLAIARDVTRRRQHEAAVAASLREKEVMLKEIHHRVKNNLQIICSLLNMQADAINDAQTRAAFGETRNRVRSMALIHEQLYQTPDLAHINLGEYLETLVASIKRSANQNGERLAFAFDCQNVALDIDRAVPCGLIVNELVTNAIKYAFPGGRSGAIQLQLRAQEQTVILSVRDDGIGMKSDFNWEQSDSIGLQLVAALTEQLEGEVALESGQSGTLWTIRFKNLKNSCANNIMATKIFVVEDEVIISKDIQRSLQKLNYEVVGSSVSGTGALEKLAAFAPETRPDLVLMDIHIKGDFDGIETAARVRDQFHIPVIYLTAYADAPTLERAKITEPFGYLLKPFEERELATAIEMGLYKHRAQRELQQSQELLFATLRSIGDGVIAADGNERVTFINPVACALTGWNETEALGAAISEVFRLDSASNHSSSHGARALIERALSGESGSAIALEPKNAMTLLRRNGLSLPVDGQITPLRDSAGEISGVVATFRDVTQTRALEERLVHQAFHDALTGLPNRALFVNRLRHTLSQVGARVQRGKAQGCLAILFIDLDNFKWVNDSLGHETGDYLLIEVAERLRRCLRATDTASRFGGDEFTILIDHVENPGYTRHIAERIVASLGEPFYLSGQTIYSSPSIGVAYSLVGQETPEELIRHADTAMYDAKRRGKGRIALFEPELSEVARQRMQLGNDLRVALARGEISLHYQPKVSLGDGQLHGVEALCRWQHPTRGAIAPTEFIPLAEEIGMIVPLGRWVLREACVQARRWQQMAPDQPPFRMNVNLSAMQLDQANFADEVQEILRETGMDADYLTLEITESVMMNEIESKLAILKNLKSLGVQLAIDDFGTGYSSLSYLQLFPLDFLKIDRQFVREGGQGGDGVILNSMISLAHALNLTVVAEGAETESEVGQLRELGCDIAQGYYFARPMPADAATAWMNERMPT